MSFSVFSVAIVCLFFVVLAIRIYIGINRGFRKSLISLGVVVTSVIVSVLLTPVISMLPAALIFDLLDLLLGRFVSGYRATMAQFPSVPLFIERMISLVLSMILVIGVFYAVRIILGIVVAIISKKTKQNNANDSEYRIEKGSCFDRNNKLLGAIAGCISAVVITMMLISPIMGTLDIAYRALGAAEQINSKSVYYIGEKNAAAIKKYSKDIPGNIFYQCGGNLIFRGAASTYMYGEKIYLLREVEIAEDTVEQAMQLYRALYDPKSDNKTRVAYMEHICENVEQLTIGKGVLADAMSTAASAWEKGYLLYGIAKPEVNGVIDPMIDELLSVCADANVESAKPITVTMLKLVTLSIDTNILFLKSEDYEQAFEIVKNSNLLDRIDAILAENPYMQNVNIHSMAMAALADCVTVSDYDPASYDLLTQELANAINAVNQKNSGPLEDRASALAHHAKKHIENYGVDVSPEMVEMVAQVLLREIGISSEVSAEDIRNIFDKYANH